MRDCGLSEYFKDQELFWMEKSYGDCVSDATGRTQSECHKSFAISLNQLRLSEDTGTFTKRSKIYERSAVPKSLLRDQTWD